MTRLLDGRDGLKSSISVVLKLSGDKPRLSDRIILGTMRHHPAARCAKSRPVASEDGGSGRFLVLL
jgi:hypothetical protein